MMDGMIGAAARRLAGALAVVSMSTVVLGSQPFENTKYPQQDKFRELDELLPTPNVYRTASGAPGPQYWQNEADHVIEATLDERENRLTGYETITYHNNSPDELSYLWVQLDRNRFTPESEQNLTQTSNGGFDRMSFSQLRQMLETMEFDGGYNITEVSDARKRDLDHTIVHTMMRVDLPEPLASGETFTFNIGWDFLINDSRVINSRTAAEYFEKDGNYLYEMAHWFPRMAAYTDYAGWQHRQFLGRGEFTLEFGDYDVKLTVPDDHIVASTGELQNPDDVLTRTQRQRLREAKTADKPMFIVTPEEALENERTPARGTKTWHYVAEDVRDFAFATSRKFIWDAQGHTVGETDTMAMSYYPNEGEPLWSRYSTHSIIHTINIYNRYSFDYPYPVAISVNGPIGGMEYPMICFNGPRPNEDGTYSARTKYGLISVIIHEVGHFYFPMIVNSDERQWTWMDEGLNTFLQFLCEQEWEDEYPSRRGEPQDIVGYMRSSRQVPIMTNSDAVLNLGPNAYAKPATALNILRETVLGRELFDHAFKTYSERWMFKRPEPADFFRTMEDASGVDLDWFWRGWFYTTDHVDISIDDVRHFRIEPANPSLQERLDKQDRAAQPVTLSKERYAGGPKYTDEFPELLDFYNRYDPLDATPGDQRRYREFIESLSPEERRLLDLGMNFYVVDFTNHGGLVMPVIVEMFYTDGTSEIIEIPAEIWRYDNEQVSKLFMTDREVERIVLDPRLETADVDLSNNHFPPQPEMSRFELFKQRGRSTDNPMREAQEEERRGSSSRRGGRSGENR
ncbi:MAG: M1 family metallopeptidase [Planctomycetota bacterium]